MNTLERLEAVTAEINEKHAEVSTKQSTITSYQNSIAAYQNLYDNCPKIGGKDCREKRSGEINHRKRLVTNLRNQIVDINRMIAELKTNKATLEAQAKVERENSVIATQTLAEQGLTIQAVEDTAETEALVQAEIAREDAAQNLEQDKQLNYIWMIALVIAIIVAIVIIRKRFKKK